MSFSVGSAVARVFGRSTRVNALAPMSPRVVRLSVQGRALEGLAFRPGDKIKIHVGDGQMRSYTPASLDPRTGVMDIVVHVHGDSAASRWAQGLAPGDEVDFVGPTQSLDGRADAIDWAVFYGDETAIGLAEAIVDGLPPGAIALGAIEVAEEDLASVDALPLDAVTREQTHGPPLVRHFRALELPAGDGLVFLSGEASSVLALRAACLDRGLARPQLRIKPYWSLRGKAHRKQLERTALRA